MTSPLSPRGQPSIVDLHADAPDTATLRPRAANADPDSRKCFEGPIQPTSPARLVLEVLAGSVHAAELDAALTWLRRNFEPWMIPTFEHRLYEADAPHRLGKLARFLAGREDVPLPTRVTAALVATGAKDTHVPSRARHEQPEEDLQEFQPEVVWLGALKSPDRADARTAIVRTASSSIHHVVARWRELAEPDRRWAISRLCGLGPHPLRSALLFLGLEDTSEAVALEALDALERIPGSQVPELPAHTAARVADHPAASVRRRVVRATRIPLRFDLRLTRESDRALFSTVVRRCLMERGAPALGACVDAARRFGDAMIVSVLEEYRGLGLPCEHVSRSLLQHRHLDVRLAASRFLSGEGGSDGSIASVG